MYTFYIRGLCIKTNSASSTKEHQLAISWAVNLFGLSVASPSCLFQSFLWASDSIRSSLVSPSCCTERNFSICKNERRLPSFCLSPFFQLFSLLCPSLTLGASKECHLRHCCFYVASGVSQA